MDMVSRAIQKGLHIYENVKLEEQTWEYFFEKEKRRRVFVFGAGGGMDYLLRNYCDCIDIFGVIDNDSKKHGHELGLYCAEAEQTKYEKITIQSPDILKNYPGDTVVVLITSMASYQPILRQLRQMGIDHCYILLMMEVNKRKIQTNVIEDNFDNIYETYIDWCCKQPIQKNKIVMLIGPYGDHARQITKVLLNKTKDVDIVWIVDDLQTERPDGIRVICGKNWKNYAYEMETAKLWIFDDLVSTRIRKRESQLYIQVKHWSSITLKKFYLDDKATYESPGIEEITRYDGGRMDYLFSGSKFDEDSCRSGFMFHGKAVRVGSPRSDILFDRTIRKKILERFGLKRHSKICLYVPTYRLEEFKKSGSMSILLDMETLLEILKEKWEGEWFLFLRLHPSLILGENVLPQNSNIINVGDYYYSEELVAASDIMITDYSSIMFEEAYQKKPVFLYAPDKQQYIDGERGLLIKYDELPFPIAESNEELYQCIRDFKEESYEKKVTEFLDKYDIHEDGHASERAADFIIGLMQEE